MRIIFEGTPRQISVKECRKALHFYGSLLLSKYQRKGVKLLIEFETGFYRREESLAEVGPEGEMYCLTIDDNLARETTLRALAHEMVHVKQFVKGELKDDPKRANLAVFNSKKLNLDKINYWDLPYEIEAYGRGSGLYYRFMEKVNERKRSTSKLSRPKAALFVT